MPKVIYLIANGGSRELEVAVGTTLMDAAIRNEVEGIVADCGGVMSCATCHVVVEEPFADLVPSRDVTEDDMLNYTAMPREPNSRLSCQIVMREALDGIRVRVADPQA